MGSNHLSGKRLLPLHCLEFWPWTKAFYQIVSLILVMSKVQQLPE